MKLKNILLLSGFLLPFGSAFAQYTGDILRFSQTEQGTTARFRALGGAQTALGGDLSSLASNPAGLGLFTKNEISFTTDYSSAGVNSGYLNTSTSMQKNKLGFNQLGAVFHLTVPKPRGADLTKGWLGFNFGIGYNRTNNFNADVEYGGINPRSSFADFIADQANVNYVTPGFNPNNLPSGSLEAMGYDNFLIDYDGSSFFAATRVNNNQRNTTYYNGSQSEINLAAGANYSNQLYIGGSISLTTLRFGADREYNESGLTQTFVGQDPRFVGASYAMSFRSNQSTDGSGINAKLGVIYRVAPNVRIGASFISPTFYTIDDIYSEVLDTRYTQANGTSIPAYTNNSMEYPTTYNFRTPYRLNGGISVVFGGSGLITGDVEYVDYSTIHFSSSNDRELASSTNLDVKRNFQPAANFRVGAEYKISTVMLRGGFNTSGNPYKAADYSSNVISAGLGYRKNSFYADLTYANSMVKYSSKPYLISTDFPDYGFTGSGESANIEDNRNNVYLTLGVRF